MLKLEKELGFIVLFPEFRFGGLRTTVSTVGSSFQGSDCLCVVPRGGRKEDLNTARSICPVVEAKDTISSMINAGLKNSKKSWNLIVVSGNVVKHNPVIKYGNWLESERDVVYRVVDKSRWRWEDSSIHGILMNKLALEEVGAFPEDEESLQMCKLIWGAKATEKGYRLKGLVGVKL